MPVRLPMRHLREILRLRYERGLSHREIARSLSISSSTVATFLERACGADLCWPLQSVPRRLLACGSCRRRGKRPRVSLPPSPHRVFLRALDVALSGAAHRPHRPCYYNGEEMGSVLLDGTCLYG